MTWLRAELAPAVAGSAAEAAIARAATAHRILPLGVWFIGERPPCRMSVWCFIWNSGIDVVDEGW